ncbi:MAG: hypothetical protein QM602_02880, partial [Microbacterium sp.]
MGETGLWMRPSPTVIVDESFPAREDTGDRRNSPGDFSSPPPTPVNSVSWTRGFFFCLVELGFAPGRRANEARRIGLSGCLEPRLAWRWGRSASDFVRDGTPPDVLDSLA